MRRILVGAVVLLTACASRPQVPIVPVDQAMTLTQPLPLRVEAVFDALRLKDHVPGASHVVEVTVTSGPNAGRRLALPYDEWTVGGLPPKTGTELTIAPRTWVAGDGSSGGRPMEGFDRERTLRR